MNANQQRAIRRVHATGAKYGITHEMISEWADDVHRAESTRDVPPHELDKLSRQIDEEGEYFVEYFIARYGPRSIMQPALIDVPETPVDRWTA